MWLRKKADSLLGAEATSIPGWTQLHAKVTRDAIVAALFLRRYNENVLPRYRDEIGIVTAHYIEAFVHEEAAAKKPVAFVMHVGKQVPRGSSIGDVEDMADIPLQTGNKCRVTFSSAKDVDGNAVAITSVVGTPDNPDMVTVAPAVDDLGNTLSDAVDVIDNPTTGVGDTTITFLLNGTLEIRVLAQVSEGPIATAEISVGPQVPR